MRKNTQEEYRHETNDVQMPEPDGEIVRNRLIKLFSDEIEETEGEIANRKNLGMGMFE